MARKDFLWTTKDSRLSSRVAYQPFRQLNSKPAAYPPSHPRRNSFLPWTWALQPLEVPIIHLAFFQLPWKLNILKDEGFFLILLQRFSVTSAFNEIAARACRAWEPGRKSYISYSQSSPKVHYGLSGHLKWWERSQLILVLVSICPTFHQSHILLGTLIPLTAEWNLGLSLKY